MAEKTPPKKTRGIDHHKVLISSQKALSEAKRALNEADQVRSQSKTLLHPSEILNGTHDTGDVWRRLMTSRGGHLRPITIDDLKEFDRLANQLGSKFEKGITAKGIIDNSLEVDRIRSRDQIKLAVPIAAKAGEIRFVTNTGPNSDRERQYVLVKMIGFEKAVIKADTPDNIAKAITRGKVQVACSCGRWRFWYAYMATRGGYNSNPQHREAAFPKIRNPSLRGLACKHILRVMAVFSQTATMRQYVARLVDTEQNKVKSILMREKKASMHELAEKIGSEGSRTRHIKTTEEKRAARSPKTEKAIADLQAKAAASAKRKQERATSNAARDLEKNAKTLLSLGAITKDQFDAMLAAVKKM